MAYVEWEITGREFVNCNCAYGCPCQFNALPTHGHCMGVAGYQIEEGHFGGTRLDGLQAVWIGQWPGPIHEGQGTMQILIDERANPAQRAASMYGLACTDNALARTTRAARGTMGMAIARSCVLRRREEQDAKWHGAPMTLGTPAHGPNWAATQSL
jgi:hypothetical protein